MPRPPAPIKIAVSVFSIVTPFLHISLLGVCETLCFQAGARKFRCRVVAKRRYLDFSSVNAEKSLVSAASEHRARACPNGIFLHLLENQRVSQLPILAYKCYGFFDTFTIIERKVTVYMKMAILCILLAQCLYSEGVLPVSRLKALEK